MLRQRHLISSRSCVTHTAATHPWPIGVQICCPAIISVSQAWPALPMCKSQHQHAMCPECRQAWHLLTHSTSLAPLRCECCRNSNGDSIMPCQGIPRSCACCHDDLARCSRLTSNDCSGGLSHVCRGASDIMQGLLAGTMNTAGTCASSPLCAGSFRLPQASGLRTEAQSVLQSG